MKPKHKTAYQEKRLRLRLRVAADNHNRYDRLLAEASRVMEDPTTHHTTAELYQRLLTNHKRLYLHWLDQLTRLSAKLSRYYKYKLGPIP